MTFSPRLENAIKSIANMIPLPFRPGALEMLRELVGAIIEEAVKRCPPERP